MKFHFFKLVILLARDNFGLFPLFTNFLPHETFVRANCFRVNNNRRTIRNFVREKILMLTSHTLKCDFLTDDTTVGTNEISYGWQVEFTMRTQNENTGSINHRYIYVDVNLLLESKIRLRFKIIGVWRERSWILSCQIRLYYYSVVDCSCDFEVNFQKTHVFAHGGCTVVGMQK